MLLYLYHEIQTLLLSGFVCGVTKAVGGSKSHGLAASLLALGGCILSTMLWLDTTPLLFVWFVLSLVHFSIHAFATPLTVAKSRAIIVDELWHAVNQILVLYYLVSMSLSYATYAGLMLVYICLIISLSYGFEDGVSSLYFVRAAMQGIFIMQVDPQPTPIPMAMLLLGVHLSVAWAITLRNAVGRALIRADVAGCAFVSEFLVLYLCHNVTIDSYLKL